MAWNEMMDRSIGILPTATHSRIPHKEYRMTQDELFYLLFGSLPRQGPGCTAATRRAWKSLSSLPDRPRILDVGCGTGTQTRDLARLSAGSIIAVDNYRPFLRSVLEWVAREGARTRVCTLRASMDALPFRNEAFDVIWSEGAIDIMGFAKGLAAWKPLCRRGGYLVISDLTLFQSEPPAELLDFLKTYNVTLRTEEEKAGEIRDAGLLLLSTFRLDEAGWLEHFYEPMAEKIAALRPAVVSSPERAAVLDSLAREGEMYRKFRKWYGYTFYMIQRPDHD
ncbi:MAG TPA: class I SAM-dependent methyltransferase [Methanolinea sp.]|nr:class I SAM-dependent methyltransferase [Methanolinea sp.]HQK56122.1 class I SAM-dependent methyltransferase [Methanolinea sp.]